MQPDSQVLVREFNRRLKAALRHVPNHVRLEAALEVESHVQDVINRSGEAEPEAEQVARILAGFGSPETYAAALSSQLPVTTTIRGGAQEILTAVVDLASGTGRLSHAMLRETIFLLKRGAHALWLFARWSGAHLETALRWSITHLKRAAVATRGPLSRFGRSMERSGQSAGRTASRLATASVLGARRTYDLWQAAAGRLSVAFRWSLRALGMAFVILLALVAFGIAGFAALAPDIAGFAVHAINTIWLDELRSRTIAVFPGDPSTYAWTGTMVMMGALAAGLLVTSLLAYYLWHTRRNRSGVIG